MKTLFSTSTTFDYMLNSAVKKPETSNPKLKVFKNVFLTFMSLLLILATTCSCDRNVTSGCGTWPMANNKTVKNFKGEAKNTNIYKNNKQFASYKKYN